jgi:hypothetical protein
MIVFLDLLKPTCGNFLIFLISAKSLVLESYLIMVRKKKERLRSSRPKIFLCSTLDPNHPASNHNCMLFIFEVNAVCY